MTKKACHFEIQQLAVNQRNVWKKCCSLCRRKTVNFTPQRRVFIANAVLGFC